MLSDPDGTHAALIVWIVGDSKPGHVNQSLGLAEALARATPVAMYRLPAWPAWRAALALLSGRAPGRGLPRPDLILGAGRATHLTLLAARHACGGRAVVLMKPGLPRRCFDLCVVPEHDGLAADAHTLPTAGALNRVRASRQLDPRQGLLLIGGASKHFAWDGDALALQIGSLLARTPDTHWTLTTSRRTPAEFLTHLPSAPNLAVTPHTATSPDWLIERFAHCGTVWVTPDSASMVTEALTAGAAVGVFDLPANPGSRIARAIADLADAHRITRFVQWCAYGKLNPNPSPLAEADRVAAHLIAWLKTGN